MRMESFTPDPSGTWVIRYSENDGSTVTDRIAGWVICTHGSDPAIHPVLIYEGHALCAQAVQAWRSWRSWEILPGR